MLLRRRKKMLLYESREHWETLKCKSTLCQGSAEEAEESYGNDYKH